MKIEELKDEEMYCLVAPDGSTQLMTLAPDYAMCIGIVTLISKKGIGEPLDKLFKKGFHVMPVKVTILQNGTENDAFNKAKKKYGG